MVTPSWFVFDNFDNELSGQVDDVIFTILRVDGNANPHAVIAIWTTCTEIFDHCSLDVGASDAHENACTRCVVSLRSGALSRRWSQQDRTHVHFLALHDLTLSPRWPRRSYEFLDLCSHYHIKGSR